MRGVRFNWNSLLTGVLLGGVLLVLGAAPADLYFADDFSGGGERAFFEGTLDSRQFRYVEGEYEIDTTNSKSYGQSVLIEELDTFRAEVTGRMVATNDPNRGGFGISFNYRQRAEGSDFLLFFVYDRGAFTVLRYLDGQSSVVHTPTKTRLFESGDAVNLKVDAAAGHFTCYINEAEVVELRDEQLTSGGCGVFAYAGSVARFDDFRIYAEPAATRGFTDDFEGERLLYEGPLGDANCRYENSAYVIDTTQTQSIGLSAYPGDHPTFQYPTALNFEFTAEAEVLSGSALGGYGIYIRDYVDDQGGFNQFRFLLSGGWFAVEQSVGDMPMALAEWVEHSAVRPAGVNQLKVRADGEQLTFYVNGVEVYHCQDANPHAGAYGFFVAGESKVAFDNVVFTEL